MSTHNINFHEQIGKNPKIILNICYLKLSENFQSTLKRVRINHGKRVTGFVIEVLLYLFQNKQYNILASLVSRFNFNDNS